MVIPEILDFFGCMVFLDGLDKQDASLSRFSVFKTDRTHEPCVPTIFGLMTDWSHELRSSTNKCKKKRYTHSVDVSLCTVLLLL